VTITLRGNKTPQFRFTITTLHYTIYYNLLMTLWGNKTPQFRFTITTLHYTIYYNLLIVWNSGS